eukprot:433260_1
MIAPNINSIHVVCVYSCNDVSFNFSMVQNATFMANSASSIDIIGPINAFKRISYAAYSDLNDYYLTQTQEIEFICNQIGGGNCIKNSDMFLGSIENVFIGCGNSGCRDSDIYIDTCPYTNPTASLNIECYNSSTSCINLLIHFESADLICQYNSSYKCYAQCNYTESPTPAPTANPTTMPTFDPTTVPTFDPTIVPTFDPTMKPTIDPTIHPTEDPTQSPSDSPTTSAPSTNPTFEVRHVVKTSSLKTYLL